MTDLKEFLLPTYKSLITLHDLNTDESTVFNWFYQKLKTFGNHNRLINNLDTFQELIFHADYDEHWDDLVDDLGFETESNSLTEEIFKSAGINIDDTYMSEYIPIDNLVDDCYGYNIEDDSYVKALYKAKENGFESVFNASNPDIIQDTLKFFDDRGFKYEKYDSETFFLDFYSWSNVYYYKISGENVESFLYFFASINNCLYIESDDEIYVGIEYPYESDGYYDYNPVNSLSRCIDAGYIDLSGDDLVNYEELMKYDKLKEFFNKISIMPTKEVIF